MKVKKNKFLADIAISALAFLPVSLFATTSTTTFTIEAQVNSNVGMICTSGGTPGSCTSLVTYAGFSNQPASFYTTSSHSYYYKASIATDATGSGNGVYYKVTDSNNTSTGQACGDGANNNCFLMQGSNDNSHKLPFQVAYEACTAATTPTVFTPGASPVGLPFSQSSSSLGSSAGCGDVTSVSSTAIAGPAPTSNANYGFLQVTIPQQTSAPAADNYSDNMTITVCDSAACT